jgi:hypothetical protein
VNGDDWAVVLLNLLLFECKGRDEGDVKVVLNTHEGLGDSFPYNVAIRPRGSDLEFTGYTTDVSVWLVLGQHRLTAARERPLTV